MKNQKLSSILLVKIKWKYNKNRTLNHQQQYVYNINIGYTMKIPYPMSDKTYKIRIDW